MKSEKLRQEFLYTIGSSYSQYGYPEYCGWIEGLLLLESKEWTQQGIAKRLGEIFPDSKYPTSVSSVNRALKILETYGVVEKTGSRKTGYSYRSLTSSGLVSSMLQQLIVINQEFMKRLEVLQVKNLEKDTELKNAISYQLEAAQIWNKAIEDLMVGFSEDSEGGAK
ncbi:MAG: hypothetical protein ACFFED_08920 [Candidatus Thorarchaeota archaeon]